MTRNASDNPGIGALIAARLARRDALRLVAGAAGALMLSGALAPPARAQAAPRFRFAEVPHGVDETDHVPPGYRKQVVLRWGDPVLPGAPAFDPTRQSAAAQSAQFGYNNDFLAFLPLPRGGQASDHGLLFVNHEYATSELMFRDLEEAPRERADIEMAAHGLTVVEIRREGRDWRTIAGPRNRRITATTPFRVAGPAAGHARLRTADDASGARVLGTLNNCAGGVTPWQTVLSGEENVDFYFSGDPAKTPEHANHARFGIHSGRRGTWWRHYPRFDIEKEPNEPNRFGWVVELDPYDPAAVPVKRTALGRFKHEGASCVVNRDGRVVVYMGDDQRGECIYRFVSAGRFDAANPAAARDLLDSGTLSVARFAADGTLRWLPLMFGAGPLTPANGFASQADVLIDARHAASLLGGTPMDRPEDIEPNPVSGRVIVALTNNKDRKPEQADGANPRPNNRHGHILELIPPGGGGRDADHAADSYRWDVLALAGNPANPADAARYHPDTTANGWFSCPDNVAFDNAGRLWVATDGAQSAAKIADGIWALEAEGPLRGLARRLYAAPVGAEVCGPCFTPDGATLFVAVQHPGEGSRFADPSTRWPDFAPGMPPRPAIVAISRDDGGVIGS